MNYKPNETANNRRNTLKDYFSLGPVFGYFFRKPNPDPNAKPNFNLAAMHTINKISMVMFLVGLIFFVVKMIMRSR